MKKNIITLGTLLICCLLTTSLNPNTETEEQAVMTMRIAQTEENCVETSVVDEELARSITTSRHSVIPYFKLSDTERRVAECIVQGEAGGESYTGKLLVAQCILNACLESEINPSEVRVQLKYSGWNENVSDDTRKAVWEVFDNGYKVVEEPILYFYAPKYCTSKWHESQTFVIAEGGHRFFKRNQ